MSKKKASEKILTHTTSKVIIKIREINKVLSEKEQEAFLSLLDKLREYDSQ